MILIYCFLNSLSNKVANKKLNFGNIIIISLLIIHFKHKIHKINSILLDLKFLSYFVNLFQIHNILNLAYYILILKSLMKFMLIPNCE